jgi:hypothetical protein
MAFTSSVAWLTGFWTLLFTIGIAIGIAIDDFALTRLFDSDSDPDSDSDGPSGTGTETGTG